MANPLQTLFASGGGHANDAIKLAALRESQLTEMKHNRDVQASARPGTYASGATDADISGMEADMHADPWTGDAAQAETAKKNALHAMLFDFNRPDVAAVRNEQLGNQMKLAAAPAEAAGKYSVQAAEAAGRERALVAQETQDHQDAMQRETQRGLDTRAAANQAGIENRAQITGLESGKIHAPRPQGEGILSRFLTGPSQTDLNQAEIQRRSGGGQPTALVGNRLIRARDPQTGVIHTAPAGTPLPAGWEMVP